MTYTDIWANLDTPAHTEPAKNTYNNLSDQECGYFNALSMALAHWPEDRKCPKEPKHHHVDPRGNENSCWYWWIAEIYAELHMKEYGE